MHQLYTLAMHPIKLNPLIYDSQNLKNKNQSLILIMCVCHSIQLAMSYASAECLPRKLEDLFSEIYN